MGYYREAIQQGSKVLPTTAIVTPTLVLWGEDDPVLGRDLTSNLEEWVEDVRVKFVADCGHWTQQEQPGVVTSEMLGWLGRAQGFP